MFFGLGDGVIDMGVVVVVVLVDCLVLLFCFLFFDGGCGGF